MAPWLEGIGPAPRSSLFALKGILFSDNQRPIGLGNSCDVR